MLLPLLTGCVLDTATRGDAGKFIVKVECDEGSSVDVQLDLDRDEAQQRIEKSGVPAPSSFP